MALCKAGVCEEEVKPAWDDKIPAKWLKLGSHFFCFPGYVICLGNALHVN